MPRKNTRKPISQAVISQAVKEDLVLLEIIKQALDRMQDPGLAAPLFFMRILSERG